MSSDVHMLFFEETIGKQKDLIAVSPLCEFFGISERNQRRVIQNDPILSKFRTKMSETTGKTGQSVPILLPKRGFIRWLQLINPNTVKEELRDMFVQCQLYVFDYLYASADMLDSARQKYRRLHELEEQERAIRKEKASIQRDLASYVDYSLGQGEIPFRIE